MEEKEKCVFVFNNGNGALLCSSCRRILKRGFEFTTDELRASKGEIDLEPRYCEICASGNKGLVVTLDSNEVLKTSNEWYIEAIEESGLIIYDPDGWDRMNYQYSFNEELITLAEFNNRVLHSTCLIDKNHNKNER